MPKKPTVGELAPDFTLAGTSGQSYSLSQFRGKPVVLVFYPGDNTPVCTLQLKSYNAGLEQFNKFDAQVLAISPQDVESHENFCGSHGFQFPLLADTEKKVAGAYGTLGPLGFPRRSVFVIDANGVVTWSHRAITGVTYRSTDEIAAALQAAQKGSA